MSVVYPNRHAGGTVKLFSLIHIFMNINPLNAMVTIWDHIIDSFKVCGTERAHWNLDILDEMHQ